MLAWLISKITSGALSAFGNAILTPIMTHLTAKTDANRDVAVQAVQAEMAANAAKAAIAPAFKGLVYGIGIPPAIHFGAICLDSTFLLNWKVAALPPSYVAIEATILTAFFVSSPLTTLARAGAARMLKA